MDDLSRRIIAVLADAWSPLKAEDIANTLRRKGHRAVTKTDVNRELYKFLAPYVCKDSEYRWRLKSTSVNPLPVIIKPKPTLKPPVPRQSKINPSVAVPPDSTASPKPDDHAASQLPVDATLSNMLRQVELHATILDTQKDNVQADIEANGGYANVLVLCDLAGKEVRAKVANSRYNPSWVILDNNGKRTNQKVPYRPTEPDTLKKRGYQEVRKRKPAVAMIIFGDSNWGTVEAVIDPKRAWAYD